MNHPPRMQARLAAGPKIDDIFPGRRLPEESPTPPSKLTTGVKGESTTRSSQKSNVGCDLRRVAVTITLLRERTIPAAGLVECLTLSVTRAVRSSAPELHSGPPAKAKELLATP